MRSLMYNKLDFCEKTFRTLRTGIRFFTCVRFSMHIKFRVRIETFSTLRTGEALPCWKAGPVPHSLRFLRIQGIRWSIYTGWCRMDMEGAGFSPGLYCVMSSSSTFQSGDKVRQSSEVFLISRPWT
ncbi:unnamed protein product, partial [Staurois parvus]